MQFCNSKYQVSSQYLNISIFLLSFHNHSLILFEMPFNATVDIFINFSYVQVRFLNRQGFLCYRVKIIYKDDKNVVNCQPYNIVRGHKEEEIAQSQASSQFSKQSQIDQGTQHYYSRVIPVRYRPADYYENQTVFFKTYINMDKIQSIKFECQIECLFSEKKDGHYDIIGNFKGKIHRIYNISTFMPISFDAFEGFAICSTFHSTIMEFKFSNEPELKLLLPFDQKTYDFWSYLDTLTKGFNRDKLYTFYMFYRDFLDSQLQMIQQRHLRLNNELNKKQKYEKINITKNPNLQKMISDKSLNSHCIMLASSQEKVIKQIQNDFAKFKSGLYEKWISFSNFISDNSVEIADSYRKQYQHESQDRFKNNVFRHRITNHNWLYSKYNDSGKTSLEKAFIVKKKYSKADQQMWVERFPIEKSEHFGKTDTNIKMFEEIYQNPQNLNQRLQPHYKRHIVVLVHGFQACRQDFFLFKNCLEVNYGVQVLISTCNEGLTQSSIFIAGRRLANEIRKTLMSLKGEFRLSFIGHSMGGLIIRAAIPELKQFEEKLYTYMSLSSPHLGYLYQSSTLIKAGLWILNTIHKCDSLLQMSMQDDIDMRKTTLYKLAFNKAFEKFEKICFLCSSQDEYVVYESARVQLDEHLISKMSKQNRNILRQMVEGMLGGKITAAELSRINVVFNIDNKNLDSFLGRTGHIKFLSDIQFIRQFCACFDSFFI